VLRVCLKPKAGNLYLLLHIFFALGILPVANGQVLPIEQSNTLTGEWLVYDNDSRELVPYVSVVHSKHNALHQWVAVVPSKPFLIGFTAQKDLCLFLNNKLIFKADSTAAYKLNLSNYTSAVKPVERKILLTTWHPSQQPNVKGFFNDVQRVNANKTQGQRPLSIKLRDYVNQNAFILFLLLIGLIYGWLRVNYPAEFQALYNISSVSRSSRLDEGLLAKPISSWSSIMFHFHWHCLLQRYIPMFSISGYLTVYSQFQKLILLQRLAYMQWVSFCLSL
jgi:hypothetical protein